jgi:phage portal protein BeeE
MKVFGRREVKTAVPLTAISDLRAAQGSGAEQLTRERFERNAVAYRCARMIAEAAASVGFRDVGGDDELVRLIARPNGEQAGPDLLETFYGHLSVTGDAFLEAVSIDGEVRELFVLRPDRMKALRGPRG